MKSRVFLISLCLTLVMGPIFLGMRSSAALTSAQSISLQGTIANPQQPYAPNPVIAAWEYKWIQNYHTPAQLDAFFDSLMLHHINVLYVRAWDLRTSGQTIDEPYALDISRELHHYNAVHGTDLQAYAWFGTWWLDAANPPDLNNATNQAAILNATEYYCVRTPYPFSGVNLDFEWYEAKWSEVVTITNLVANTYPNLIVSVDVPCGLSEMYGRVFNSNVAYTVVMIYDTGLGGNDYANYLSTEITNQLAGTNKSVVFGLPSYWTDANHLSSENITYAFQGLQAASPTTPYGYGISLYDYDYANATSSVWDVWNQTVAFVESTMPTPTPTPIST